MNDLEQNSADLITVVEHHVIDGTDLSGRGETIGATEGGQVDITVSGDRVTGVDNARVLRTIPYKNGVIYEIDQVLLPDDQNLINRYSLNNTNGSMSGQTVGTVGTAGGANVTVTQPVIVKQPEPVVVQPQQAPVRVEQPQPVNVNTETVPVVTNRT